MGRIMDPSDFVMLHGKRDFAAVIKAQDLQMEEVALHYTGGPIQSHEYLKAECLSWLQRTREDGSGMVCVARFSCWRKVATSKGRWQPLETSKGKETFSL